MGICILFAAVIAGAAFYAKYEDKPCVQRLISKTAKIFRLEK